MPIGGLIYLYKCILFRKSNFTHDGHIHSAFKKILLIFILFTEIYDVFKYYHFTCQRSPQLLSLFILTDLFTAQEFDLFSASSLSYSAVSKGSEIFLLPFHSDKYAAFETVSSFIPSYGTYEKAKVFTDDGGKVCPA